jgi:hypothetical protein
MRHIGALPRPVARRDVVRSYRLLAADDDAGIGDEIRRCLAESGIGEVADGAGGDRDIVVLTDRTPVGWLSRDDLCHPPAVVATSITLPVRGVLERQWVDYRARRARTLPVLGRDLAGAWGPVAEPRAAPEIPERLQQRRFPPWVAVVEWTLYSMAALAAPAAHHRSRPRPRAVRAEQSWGAAMKPRLIAGLERIIRADRALVRHEITRRRHEREYDEANGAAADLAAATC